MAGHSQFKNIMYRKGAQDAKRAKIFTKIIRELTVSAKEGGGDLNSNPRLRAAVITAREANMPKDTMERAIKRGAGGEDMTSYEEVRYEGYGPGGSAVIVEVLTDNRNRTASEVRSAFSKHGGSLGETHSVSFLFDRRGLIVFPLAVAPTDEMFEAALEVGAEDVSQTEESHEILTDVESFGQVRDALVNKYGDASARLIWVPKSLASVAMETRPTLEKLIDVLEDNDDVQMVWTNAE